MINGSADALNQPKTILLSESTAKKFFGTTDVIGQTIFRGKQADNNAWTIGGVYKRFPGKFTDKKLGYDAQRSRY